MLNQSISDVGANSTSWMMIYITKSTTVRWILPLKIISVIIKTGEKRKIKHNFLFDCKKKKTFLNSLIEFFTRVLFSRFSTVIARHSADFFRENHHIITKNCTKKANPFHT